MSIAATYLLYTRTQAFDYRWVYSSKDYELDKFIFDITTGLYGNEPEGISSLFFKFEPYNVYCLINYGVHEKRKRYDSPLDSAVPPRVINELSCLLIEDSPSISYKDIYALNVILSDLNEEVMPKVEKLPINPSIEPIEHIYEKEHLSDIYSSSFKEKINTTHQIELSDLNSLLPKNNFKPSPDIDNYNFQFGYAQNYSFEDLIHIISSFKLSMDVHPSFLVAEAVPKISNIKEIAYVGSWICSFYLENTKNNPSSTSEYFFSNVTPKTTEKTKHSESIALSNDEDALSNSEYKTLPKNISKKTDYTSAEPLVLGTKESQISNYFERPELAPSSLSNKKHQLTPGNTPQSLNFSRETQPKKGHIFTLDKWANYYNAENRIILSINYNGDSPIYIFNIKIADIFFDIQVLTATLLQLLHPLRTMDNEMYDRWDKTIRTLEDFLNQSIHHDAIDIHDEKHHIQNIFNLYSRTKLKNYESSVAWNSSLDYLCSKLFLAVDYFQQKLKHDI